MPEPPSQPDAVKPPPPDDVRRSLQGDKADREAQRSVNEIGVEGGVSSAAWPLASVVVCLIVYASLYPFSEWRNQGISPLIFLTAPLPKYWTGFDVAINITGYAPLGFLLTLASLRGGHLKWAMLLAVCFAALLSLSMEALQSYLPSRVPSNVDLALNTLGALLGACAVWGLERLGALGRWSRVHERWLAPDARGGLTLLLLWPVALLFPAAVPMGLGQVFERLEAGLAEQLVGTPFLVWLPVRDIELQPLVPLAELLCVALGALIPLLLGYGVVRTLWQRAVLAPAVLVLGMGVSALSSALSYGPQHAWAWLDEPVQAGMGLAAILALLLLPLSRRGAAAVALLALALQLGVLNQAPASAYFAQTLQTWEQGRFIRFHGLVQWLGWVWPYAVLLYLLARLSAREDAGSSKT